MITTEKTLVEKTSYGKTVEKSVGLEKIEKLFSQNFKSKSRRMPGTLQNTKEHLKRIKTHEERSIFR